MCVYPLYRECNVGMCHNPSIHRHFIEKKSGIIWVDVAYMWNLAKKNIYYKVFLTKF